MLVFMLCIGFLGTQLQASSHREAPLISNDPLADNLDLYAFRSPDDPSTVTLIATNIPMQLPQGGPNYYNFGENIRYEIHVDNNTSTPGDDVVYRFTFTKVNEDPTTFFNIRLGKQNQKTTYKLERSLNGGGVFETIIENGIVPPNNIGNRSIESPVGLGTTYETLFNNAITTAETGEQVFAGPVDDPFFVDLGGIFDLGDAPRQGGKAVDGLACYNAHAIAIQVPIRILLASGVSNVPDNILDPNYVIGVWASASRPSIRTLSSTAAPTYEGDWIQVSRIGMPLTNEAVIAIGDKDYWNSITPYEEISETTLDEYFYNPELGLYMDDDLFGGAVPAFSPLRIQKASLGAFDFTNGADGLFGLKGSDAVAGTALDDAVFGSLLLPAPGKPRSVDLWPIFHTGVPNVIPYQLATGKEGNPLATGKPFINNFLPNGGDMLRINLAVPVTDRDDPNFSSLGLIQAAVLGLTTPPYFLTTDLEFIPNMDGFPNGRRLEDDVTRIELQAVAGAVLAAVGLWYDDYDPNTSPSPLTDDLLNVLSFTTGVENNDLAFSPNFPYMAMPHSGTGDCSGEPFLNSVFDLDAQIYVSSNTSSTIAVYGVSEDNELFSTETPAGGEDADGIHYDNVNDILYQLNRSTNKIDVYKGFQAALSAEMTPSLAYSSSSDFINGREIAADENNLIVAQDANDANGNQNRIVIYAIENDAITLANSFDVAENLWGIHLDGNRLFAIQDNSNILLIYNDILSATGDQLTPDVKVSVDSLERTHGITYGSLEDKMILTDIGSAGNAEDGGFIVINNFMTASEDGQIQMEEQIKIEGPNSMLGNPVDIAYDRNSGLIFVAERAVGGGQFLAFESPTESGDVSPLFQEARPGASAVYFSSPAQEEIVEAQLFASSNNASRIGLFDLTSRDVNFETSVIAAMDADGIYYDKSSDRLYQLNRTDNRIDVYENVNANLVKGSRPDLVNSSTSDFINGREMAVFGNQIVVAQDANDANGNQNRFYIYSFDGADIQLQKTYDSEINLWGIHLNGNTLFAIEDNSDKIHHYNNFFSNSSGPVSSDQVITIASMIRTHGLTYDAANDIMILTDVGAASSPTDGAVTLISRYMEVAADNLISDDEQFRIEGPLTSLGNPVDVAYDVSNEMVYVAERASGGGLILGFESPAQDGDVSPTYNQAFAGASAVYFSQNNQPILTPSIVTVNPNFDETFILTSRLSGSNEVPAVETNAVGVASLTFNEDYTMATLNMTVSELSSAITGVHIHNGVAGMNGDVVLGLTDLMNQGRVQHTFAIDATERLAYMNGERYINVHTETNPSGEIRGNLSIEAPASFAAVLDGSNEVPAVVTDARGIISMNYTSNTNELEINFMATGLSGPITGIHLHNGILGENGPVVENLTSMLVGNSIKVKIQAGDYIDALRSGSIYLNVHTETNPGGEIRANLTTMNGLYFDSWLNSQQEVPAIESNTYGLAFGKVDANLGEVEVNFVLENGSGELQAAHFHNAALGSNGGVVLNLSDIIDGQSGLTTTPFAIDAVFLDQFLAGDLYLNIHTEANPSGEARGQIYRVARDGYAFDICPDQELHNTSGTEQISGSGIYAINRDMDEAHLMIVANDLTSGFEGAHIHNAPMGENGDVIVNLTDQFTNNGVFSYYTEKSDSPVTAGLVEQIQTGNAYINIHTTDNPAGELRGQIIKTLECPLSTSIIETAQGDLNYQVYPNPVQQQLVLEFEADLFRSSTLSLKVFNAQGQEMMNIIDINNVKTLLNVKSFPKGVYQLSIYADSNVSTSTFIKID